MKVNGLLQRSQRFITCGALLRQHKKTNAAATFGCSQSAALELASLCDNKRAQRHSDVHKSGFEASDAAVALKVPRDPVQL